MGSRLFQLVRSLFPILCVAVVACAPSSEEFEGESNSHQTTSHDPVDCCQEDDPCGLSGDGFCDCQGQFAWNYADCWKNSSECCQTSNPCLWADDGFCDCGGMFVWDASDCGITEKQFACCRPSDPCSWEDNQRCECEGSFTWDEADCRGEATQDCCRADNPCGLANDGVCNCNGTQAWDTQDCDPASCAGRECSSWEDCPHISCECEENTWVAARTCRYCECLPAEEVCPTACTDLGYDGWLGLPEDQPGDQPEECDLSRFTNTTCGRCAADECCESATVCMLDPSCSDLLNCIRECVFYELGDELYCEDDCNGSYSVQTGLLYDEMDDCMDAHCPSDCY